MEDAEDAEIDELFSNRDTEIGEERANLSGLRLGADSVAPPAYTVSRVFNLLPSA